MGSTDHERAVLNKFGIIIIVVRRPTVRENIALLGDLRNDFDFSQAQPYPLQGTRQK